MRLPMLARALIIGAVAVAILVPIAMIDNKISERQARAQGVTAQFASETSGPQLVMGPLIAMTCVETYESDRQVARQGKLETVSEKKTRPCPTAFFTPRMMSATGRMPVDTVHRGIYSIRLFRADLALQGEFEWPQPPDRDGFNARAWKDAYLVTFVSDPRGIKSISSGVSPELLAGTGEPRVEQFSIRESLGAWSARKPGSVMPFSYKIALVGTSSLQIAPVADRNEIRLASDWPHPSFGAAWSPDVRNVSPDGFDATWRITSVATGGQAAWSKLVTDQRLPGARGAGVSFFDPVNVYALSYRATQYAFLFVLFTFCALALAEVLAGVRLHPVQYALVGCALAVFFLLLIALSEHVPFRWAYLAAAAACVALLTFYLRHPLQSAPRTLAFFAIFVSLYGALYVLLKSEDHALLLGSLMVFVLLSVVMIATRKTDWTTLAGRFA